jgi:ABC-type transport system substrate-binding protein
MSILFYQRPSYVEQPGGPLNPEDCQKYVERMKNNKNAVPPELSFERVIRDEALPVSLPTAALCLEREKDTNAIAAM